MICPHCAAGADLTTDPAPVLAAVRQLAVEEHAKCPGGTWCDCQHTVASPDELVKRRAAMSRGGLARIVEMFRCMIGA